MGVYRYRGNEVSRCRGRALEIEDWKLEEPEKSFNAEGRGPPLRADRRGPQGKALGLDFI